MSTTTTAHPNSRKVTILRSNNFLSDAQKDPSAQEYIEAASRPLGPYYENHAAGTIGSGMHPSEIAIILPHIISIEASDKDFKKEVFKYFNELVTKVPATSGLDLEVGLFLDNDKPVSEANLPLSPVDYVRWRHAKNHPWVADNREAARRDSKKYFYIYDKEAHNKIEQDKLVIQDKADEIYLKMKNNAGKVEQMLVRFGLDPRDFMGRQKNQQQQQALKKLTQDKASKFIEYYEEERFEQQYWLRAMVAAGVVKQIGTAYVDANNNKKLGHSELETLLFLEDKKNADVVSVLKSNTQEILSKPNHGKRKTARI